MKIICNKCKHTMEGSEAYATFAWSLAKIFAPLVVQEIIQAVKFYWSARSIGYNIASAFANRYDIECPNCNAKHFWSPFPEVEVIAKNKSKKKPVQEQV